MSSPTATEVADAMQAAWNAFCTDTGNIPDAFTIHGPSTTRVSADMHRGNFASYVADYLDREGPT